MPAPEPSIDWEFMADFDDDGTYEADLTPYARSYRYDLGREDALAAFGARTLTVVLGNADSRFSPKNTAGPYAPDLLRGRRVRLRGTPGRTFADLTNLVENPSVEGGTSGYALRAASIALDSTKTFWGRDSLKVTTTNVTQSGTFVRRTGGVTRFTVTAGSNYDFRCYLAAPAGKFIGISIRWFSAVPALINETLVASLEGRGVDNWLRTDSSTQTAPVGAVTAELSASTDGVQGVFDFWIDGATFHIATVSRPYVDGDQSGCTWAGTAHASQSTRLLTAQQLIPQFTGRIRDFHLNRDPEMWESEVEMECTTDDEAWAHKVISIGPCTRKKAKDIVQLVVDRLEEGEIIIDGCWRNTQTGGVVAAQDPPAGENFTPIGTPTTFSHGSSGKADPAEYAAMEGDNIMAIGWGLDAIGDGWSISVTSRTTAGSAWTATCFFTCEAINNGLRHRFQLWDNVGGAVAESTVTLIAGEYVYVVVAGTFTAGSTSREVRVIAQDTPFTESNGLLWSCLHMVPTANRIARTVTGLDYDLELFPQGGFHRSAMAILEEFCRSAGAFMYVDASGGLVFDQTDTARSSSAVPELRLTDYTDGLMYALNGYSEGTNNIYNRIRVGSYGDISHIGSNRRVWQREPAALVLGNNEERTLYVDFPAEEQGMMLARLANAKVVLSAGAMVANYPILAGYGSSAEIVLKAGAAGATVTELFAEARVQNRNTNERTFLEFTHGGGPFQGQTIKVLELEMPGQGYKTAQMSAVATWAANKYVEGPVRLSVEITGGPVGTGEDGQVGWQYVMEILDREVGTAVWVKHMTGPGALFLDQLFYVERRTVIARRNEPPRMRLELEAA